MNPMRLVVVPMCLLLLIPAGVAADCPTGTTYTHFNLSVLGGQEHYPCQWIIGNGPRFLQVRVMLHTLPVSKVRFSMPDPPFGNFLGVQWDFPFTGNHVDGIELDLGCAGPGHFAIGTFFITLEPLESVPCTEWDIDDSVEAEDCHGNLQPAVAPEFRFTSVLDYACGDFCWQYCEGLPPHNVHPADGATDVPIATALSWAGPVFDYVDEFFECGITLWTDPDCTTGESFVVPCDAPSVVPGLEPSTTYYWQAQWAILAGSGCSNGSGDRGISPVYSFTTEPPLAARRATWGGVKAMYRE